METKLRLASTLKMLLEQKKIRVPTIHDDTLWALALACHAAKIDRSKPIILFGR